MTHTDTIREALTRYSVYERNTLRVKRADEALEAIEREQREVRALLHDIVLQASRKKRASGLKRYLETDLDIILHKAEQALNLLRKKPVEDDMSLRPRPGESPEDVVARVIAAARRKP